MGGDTMIPDRAGWWWFKSKITNEWEPVRLFNRDGFGLEFVDNVSLVPITALERETLEWGPRIPDPDELETMRTELVRKIEANPEAFQGDAGKLTWKQYRANSRYKP